MKSSNLLSINILIIILILSKQKSVLFASIINPSECGKRIDEIQVHKDQRIIGGEEANSGDWGWQAILYFRGAFICGGSLINNEWVITAAHCISSNNAPSDYSIRLGLHNRFNPENYSIMVNISKFIIHSRYNSSNLHNDIALLKLMSKIEYSDYIVPVCLPLPGHDFSNENSFATGWGRINTNSSITSTSPVLMQIETKILSIDGCQERYKTLPSFDSSVNICAGGNGKSICQGDSGGPIIVKVGNKWELAGISSWVLVNPNTGTRCFDGGVFTKTSSYIGWIKENIQEESVTLQPPTSSSLPKQLATFLAFYNFFVLILLI